MHIAMWSGPRNLSTAMMYAFAQRSDCAVWDEPFYAAYLSRTDLDHPMREDIIAAGLSDPEDVIARCTGAVPGGATHLYQKHMCQHMLPGIDRGWLAEVANVFLIRHPARVVASFTSKRENPEFDELGFRQQYELYEQAFAAGQTPHVVDSADIREDPERALRGICAAIGVSFDPAMLSWPAGGRQEDGVWAPVWYGAIHESTGFAGAEGPLPVLTGHAAALAEQALPFYTSLKREAE